MIKFNELALDAAAKAVENSATVWEGFSMQDALTCIKAYYAYVNEPIKSKILQTKDPSSCTHTTSRWEPDEYEEDDGNSGQMVMYNTYEDTGLHTFICTQCCKVMYYSGVAKDHYEGRVFSQRIEDSAANYQHQYPNK